MKNGMQRYGIGIAALLFGAGLMVGPAAAQDAPPPPTSGQQQGPPPGGPRGGMDPATRALRVQKQLGLTDDVTAQVKAIYSDSGAKMQALRESGSASREDMMAIRTAETAKVKALLTPDQSTKYDEMLAQQRGRGQNGPPPGGGGTPPPQ